jgi:hypothetical protein
MTGREHAAVLREAAEFFDAHPYLPVPDEATSLVLYYQHPNPAGEPQLKGKRTALQ